MLLERLAELECPLVKLLSSENELAIPSNFDNVCVWLLDLVDERLGGSSTTSGTFDRLCQLRVSKESQLKNFNDTGDTLFKMHLLEELIEVLGTFKEDRVDIQRFINSTVNERLDALFKNDEEVFSAQFQSIVNASNIEPMSQEEVTKNDMEMTSRIAGMKESLSSHPNVEHDPQLDEQLKKAYLKLTANVKHFNQDFSVEIQPWIKHDDEMAKQAPTAIRNLSALHANISEMSSVLGALNDVKSTTQMLQRVRRMLK